MKVLIIVLSIVAGGVLGWMYYRFIGCHSGTCPITSKPWSSIIAGVIVSYLFLPELLTRIFKIGG